MASYLLLRNNKESGPYTLEDLTELGLKAYDLVWVQGKSAAWRYPSEVEELKPFAPAVEEQPFDRFYKKPAEEKKKEPLKEQTTSIAPEHEKYIPKKSVFVTLPAQKVTTVVKPAVAEENHLATATVSSRQTISVTENPVAAQVKYSQPLDEIKEMYVKTLQDRRQKIARKSFLVQSLKKAAILLFLVGIGVVAGLLIKSKGSKKTGIVQQPSSMVLQQEPLQLKTTADIPATTESGIREELQPVEPPAESASAGAPAVTEEFVSRKQPVVKNKTAVDEGKKETVPVSPREVNPAALSPGVEINPATGERVKKIRSENSGAGNGNTGPAVADKEKRSVASSHVPDQVSVSANDYKKVAFGGIRNLELTVTNDSKYLLDNVIVELQYIKPNELPLKTTNIEFRSVGPKSTSTIRLPDTNRGIRVVYRIINVHSRQMDEVAGGN